MVLQVAHALRRSRLWLMRLAAQLRGRPHWADVFFPVSLLHLGHWENFLMGYQICFVAVHACWRPAIGGRRPADDAQTAFRSGSWPACWP